MNHRELSNLALNLIESKEHWEETWLEVCENQKPEWAEKLAAAMMPELTRRLPKLIPESIIKRNPEGTTPFPPPLKNEDV